MGLRPKIRFGIGRAEQLDEWRNQSGPPRLMTRADAGAVVAMEILVEEEVVPPVVVALEFPDPAVHGPGALLVAEEDRHETPRDLVRDLVQGHEPPRAGRAFDGEILAVIGVEVDERPHDEHVHWQPDRTAPVRVATEHAARRLRWLVVDTIRRAVDIEHV